MVHCFCLITGGTCFSVFVSWYVDPVSSYHVHVMHCFIEELLDCDLYRWFPDALPNGSVCFEFSCYLVHGCMASWVSCRFCVVEFLSLVLFFSMIPLYALACMSVDNFAPCRSNSLGISRFSLSASHLLAPCFARRLLSSFPWMPLWPLTHCRVVFAAWYHNRWADFLKKGAFFIPIHPSSSQVCR
jgi:hypothetical protein